MEKAENERRRQLDRHAAGRPAALLRCRCCRGCRNCADARAGRTGCSWTRPTTCCRLSWEPGSAGPAGDAGADGVHHRPAEPGRRRRSLAAVDTVVAVGRGPGRDARPILRGHQRHARRRSCRQESGDRRGLAVATRVGPAAVPRQVGDQPHRPPPAHAASTPRARLPPDKSFYFRGPEGKLNLRAQNLMLFLQLADGVDDETWLHHLRQGDYSGWFREFGSRTRAGDRGGRRSRSVPACRRRKAARLIRAAVERHYTLPAAAPLPMPGTKAAPSATDRPLFRYSSRPHAASTAASRLPDRISRSTASRSRCSVRSRPSGRTCSRTC